MVGAGGGDVSDKQTQANRQSADAAHPHSFPAAPDAFDGAFWDERYRSHSSLWSGKPNPHLVSETGGLAPGTALDAGCGEGADAIWLAGRGWRVTAVELSAVALQRAADNARRLGADADADAAADAAERIEWVHQDLASWEPGPVRYDLVSAQYLHLLPEPRQALFSRLAAAVAPGGTLLIVGHHPSDLQTTMPRPPILGLYFTGDDIASALDPGDWDIVTNAAAERTATDPDGQAVTIHDTVLRARRRNASSPR
jgi:SAM-dependent methyltransferase